MRSRLVNLSFLAVMTVLGLNAEPVRAANDSDPLEFINRPIFTFNDWMDRLLFKPVAKGYDYVMPGFAKTGVSNFMSNLGELNVILNDVLQLKGTQAASDSGRFLLNSTVGIFGLIDVGTRIGLDKHDEDFGQTLGYWGVPTGPYLMLPFLGPSDLRDAPGKGVDLAVQNAYEPGSEQDKWSVWFVDKVDQRASLLKTEKI
ncbi:MAG TPA: VacJ family lipoprotein, partial [Pseudomonadales bacterium]|nr:VacJ family lipoprotein [Pseudomonadales bacterium]